VARYAAKSVPAQAGDPRIAGAAPHQALPPAQTPQGFADLLNTIEVSVATAPLLLKPLVVTKLDRLARSLPDARDIADELTSRQVKLNLGGSIHDPTDPVGRLLFNVLAMVAEFEADLIRMRTREGMTVARARGRLRGKQPKLNPRQEAHLVSLHNAGTHTSAELAELFSVARSTVYRAIQRAAARSAN
jgi:DNA invertase Pin-like site-specific DNA recombinase